MSGMKRAKSVGKDFDAYAEAWKDQDYGMEIPSGAEGSRVDPSLKDQVRRPGDEWGEQAALRDLYAQLFPRLLGKQAGPLNVLEIGAGGGRSTEAVVDVLGATLGEYHVVDVSAAFTEVLRERVTRPVEIHIVDDVDLSALPTDHFHLVLAQSSWSHINLYDQYRYLRELRRVMRHGAPVVVHGLFLLGLGNDWTWNRFRRRVHQIDHDLDGVYHEVTSADGVAEMLLRLEYEIVVITDEGFVARSRQRSTDANRAELPPGSIAYPALDMPSFAAGGTPRTVTR
jgi:SAM-dependent methyltransferase